KRGISSKSFHANTAPLGCGSTMPTKVQEIIMDEFIQHILERLNDRGITKHTEKWFNEEILKPLRKDCILAVRVHNGWSLEFVPGTDIRNATYYMYYLSFYTKNQITTMF